jgi:hypothetical protein
MLAEIQLGSRVHCYLHLETYFYCQKIPTKKLACTSRQSMCVRIVLQKKKCGRKKDKTCPTKSLTLSTNFFLHSPDEKSIIHGKTLCAHSMRRCTRDFSCLKFDILKCLKDAFQNKGGICNRETKHHSQQWIFCLMLLKFGIFQVDMQG